MKTAAIILLTVVVTALGCTHETAKKEVEGYRVISHDTKTGEWVILRNGTFDGKYLVKRITAVCSYYRLGNGEMVEGPDACDLRVGEMMVPNPLAKDAKDFLDVWEMPTDTLVITKGRGSDKVTQSLSILKYEVVP
jgi:hypothetical protein